MNTDKIERINKMMKFTLYSNDNELNFKLKQGWDYSTPTTVINNAYCYKNFMELIDSRKHYAGDNWAKNIFSLEISKNKGSITYEIEDMKFDFEGEGSKTKIIRIEASVDEASNKAKIKIKANQEPSLSEKILSGISNISNKIDKKREIYKQKKFDEAKSDRELIENIIEQKAKETITDEY